MTIYISVGSVRYIKIKIAGSGTVDAAVVVGVLGAALTIEFNDLSRWCQVGNRLMVTSFCHVFRVLLSCQS